MKHLFKIRIFLLLPAFFFISLQPFQAYAGGIKMMGITQIFTAKFLLANFIIGNVVAWSMGAYPRSFEQTPYTQEEQEQIRELREEIRTYPDEVDPLQQLGLLYFSHNDLDKAKTVLENALTIDPNHAESLAVWGANEAKSAGAMWDFTFGIWKLMRLDNAIEGLNRAVELKPDNFNVRLFRLNTLEALKNLRDSLPYAFADERWYLEKTGSNPQYLPDNVHLEFLDVLTRLYLVKCKIADDEEKGESQRRALDYFNRLKRLPVSKDRKEPRIRNITERFSEQNIPFKIID